MATFNYLHALEHLRCVSKNDNDVLRYNFNAHQPILIIFADILLNEYPIKW